MFDQVLPHSSSTLASALSNIPVNTASEIPALFTLSNEGYLYFPVIALVFGGIFPLVSSPKVINPSV